MQAIIVGVSRYDFDDKGRVKGTKYYLNLPGVNIEGYKVGSVSWNEIKRNKESPYSLGEVIDVEYNEKGKLIFSESLVPIEPKKGA